jgi:hypothetical protein
MTVKNLEQNLGETGAYTDRSSGKDNLYDVVTAIANSGPTLDAYQATIATGIIASKILFGDHIIKKLKIYVGVCGTADTTTVQVLKNSVSQGELSVAHSVADGAASELVIADIACVAGDRIEINVSAAPTAGTDLIASVQLAPVLVK